jgi:nucleoside-diphosphate-sugar epimerase
LQVRVVVVGASGNVGTSVLRSLADEPAVASVLGVARRLPRAQFPKTEWATADVSRDDLEPLFRGADCVVHLAWLIQPSRDQQHMWRTNVFGSRRVFRAVVDAGVRSLVYASSVGTYSAGPKDRRVDESWPVDAIQTNTYARHKAAVERELDLLELERPELRVVRMRPAFIFKRAAGSGVRRLFLGPFVPNPLVRPALIPVVPEHPRFRFQGLHSHDAGEAYRLAIVGDARGAFNLAAEPVLDGPRLGRILGAKAVRVGPRPFRAFVEATWRLRLQPVDGSWVDLAYGVPLLDTARAREELGWEPAWSADRALLDLIGGIADSAGLDTPPLSPDRTRLEELRTGVGGSELL